MEWTKWMRMPDIKGKRVVYVTGEESYLADLLVDHVKKVCLDGCVQELNFQKIETSLDKGALEARVATMPFMCACRVVLVDDFASVAGDWLKTAEELESFIGGIPETTMLILKSGQTDKRSVAYRFFKKKGLLYEAGRLTPDGFEAWVRASLERRGLSVKTSDFRFLIKRLGYFNKEVPTTLQDVEREIEKLASKSFGAGCIERKDMQALVDPAGETNIFKLTDHLTEGRTGQALESLEILLGRGEPEMKLLFMIGRQFRMLMKVKTLAEYGYPAKDISQTLGIKSDFVLKKALRQAASIGKPALGAVLDRCLETETKCKSATSWKSLPIELLICDIGRLLYLDRQKK